MTVLGLDTVAVVVSDPRKAILWYRDVLGLPVAYLGPSESTSDPGVQGSAEAPGHWIEMGRSAPRTRIHLCVMGGQTEPGPTGITFLTDDIAADHERLRAKGVPFLSPPRRMDWGEWIAEFADPDGNRFDLKQPLDPSAWRA